LALLSGFLLNLTSDRSKKNQYSVDEWDVSRYSTQNPKSATIKFSSGGIAQSIPSLYEEMRGRRLTLESSAPLPVSAAVKVEYDDALFLGEVLICCEINDLWKVEINVEQILTGLQSLIALRSRLLCENTVQPLRMASVEVAKVA
jgi:hypothetical protein